jgi:hypothetical protein
MSDIKLCEHEVIEQIYLAMMSRLYDLTERGVIHTDWVGNIEEYGLGYEVAYSSGLSLDIIANSNSNTFLDLVSTGMFAWDI